jgi:hypothetical protein
MDIQQFNSLVREFADYMDKAGITTRQIDLWHKKCEHIPVMARDYILDFLTNECNSFPRNLPKQIKEGWHLYQKAHPEKMTKEKLDGCTECDSRGIIWFKRFDKETGREAEFIARCSKCQNWRKHFNPGCSIQATSRDRLIADGCKIHPYSQQFRQADIPIGNVNMLLKGIGEEIPF